MHDLFLTLVQVLVQTQTPELPTQPFHHLLDMPGMLAPEGQTLLVASDICAQGRGWAAGIDTLTFWAALRRPVFATGGVHQLRQGPGS